MKKIKLVIKDIVILMSTFLLMLLLTYLFYPIVKKNNKFEPAIETLIYLLISLYLFIIYRKEIINYFKDFRLNYKKYISKNFEFFLICILAMMILNIILVEFIGQMPTNEELNKSSIKNNLFFSFLQVCIFAPFYEEVLFRLNFKNLFKNKIIFSIFTGLIFGSMHLISAKSLIEIPFILSYSIAGFALGYVFYDTNNIFTSMFFHFFNNFLSLILTVIGEYLWKG